MVKLSTRLRIVYEMIDKCDCIADIGCDHGFLSIAIAEGQKANKVIAMDINKGPLEAASKNVSSAGFSDTIELRLSDGLQKLSTGEAQGICICGMGGVLMKRIVDNDIETAKAADFLILEPQSEYYEFRQFLHEQGFVFDDEDLVVEENKTYPIIKVHFEENNRAELSEVQLKYGPWILKKNPALLGDYLDKSEKEVSEILVKLRNQLGTGIVKGPINARILELEHELQLIEKARGYVQGD